MYPTYHIPGRFHPGHALLGRWLRRRMGDARQAEAAVIAGVAAGALVLVLAQYLAWGLLPHPPGAFDARFLAVQLGLLAVAAGVAVVGFEPGVTVACTADHLVVRQGPRHRRVAYADVASVEPVSALRFHRHYRRYAATDVFATRLPDTLLLLQTPDGPLVLGLSEPDRLHLSAFLAESRLLVVRG